MIILIALAVLFASWAATQLLRRAQRVRTIAVSALLRRAGQAHTPVHPTQAYAKLPSGASSSSSGHDALTWTALDDVQLTRLLTEAARGTNTE